MGDIASALSMIFIPANLLGLVFGVAVGIAFGCMPGLSVNMGLHCCFRWRLALMVSAVF